MQSEFLFRPEELICPSQVPGKARPRQGRSSFPKPEPTLTSSFRCSSRRVNVLCLTKVFASNQGPRGPPRFWHPGSVASWSVPIRVEDRPLPPAHRGFPPVSREGV